MLKCQKDAGAVYYIPRCTRSEMSQGCFEPYTSNAALTECMSWQLMVETEMGGTGLSPGRGGPRRYSRRWW